MDDEACVRAAYADMYAAMIKKDRAALICLLGEEFVLVHMTGMRQGKTAFINAVASGTLNYYSALHEDISADVRGSEARLRGRSRVEAAVFGGGRHIWRFQLDIQLKKEGAAWKISRAVASSY